MIKKALMNVSHPGRIDYILPNLFIDGAHNEDGIVELKKYVETVQKHYKHIYYCFLLKK
jgi:folylpolyglutamate synthase/dihydropteroate synthase